MTVRASPAVSSSLHRDIVVIGGSAGALEALVQLVSALPKAPEKLHAAIFIVVHTSPEFPSKLAEVLGRHTTMPVELAVHGDRIRHGRIYVAPADNHLTIDRHTVRVVRGPKDNGHRPAVDPLFNTAARAFGNRVVGVVLSGMLSCGTQGLGTIRSRGGLVLVQRPDDCLYGDMPNSALAHVPADFVSTAGELGPLITELVAAPLNSAEVEPMPNTNDTEPPGTPFRQVTCPECSGSMTESEAYGLLQFRCHVGHVFSLDALVYEQSAALEAALWASVRALEETAEMARRVAGRSDVALSRRFQEKHDALMQHADLIKEIVTNGTLMTRVDALAVEPTSGERSNAEAQPAPERQAH